jgi:tetratricopeptide (TPR) repeat protein
MKITQRILGIALLTALASGGCAAQAQGSKPLSTTQTMPTLSQADAAWNEKSYARALELYQKLLTSNNVRDRDEIEYRIAVSLSKTEQWDKAIAAGEALLEKTTWKARVLYWMGRLYTVVPHQGYRVGGKIYRGEDYPKIEGAEKPQQVWVGEEDADKTLEFFERAKVRAREERDIAMRARFSSPTHLLSAKEEIDLNFDLAAWLPRRQYDEFLKALEKGENKGEVVNTSAPYSPQWNLPTKVLYLYNQIRVLDALDSDSRSEKTPLSLLAKGLFVRAYRQRMEGWANHYDQTQKKYIKRPYPFDTIDAVSSWEQLVREFPRSSVADRAQILIAQTWQGRNDQVKALAAYRRVLVLFPRSKWANDARTQIQQITKREIYLDTSVQQKPGEVAKLNLRTRNLKTIGLTAYRIKLENVLTQASKLKDPETRFTEFRKNFGSVANLRNLGAVPVAEWQFSAKDKGDYQQTYETITTPLKERGAYVVVAQSGGVRFAQVLLISDLVILKKADRDSAFAYVADARTGHPVPGANVVLKEVYWKGGNNSDVLQGKTDAQGFFDKPLTRGRESYSSGNVEAFAWIGDRYAMTSQSYYYTGYYGDNRDELKVYSYTDRPVYRPAQKVYFRQILTQRIKGGDQSPTKNVEVDVTVRNPKGETVFNKKITSSEFGTINGEFDLPTETPLGEYSIEAAVQRTASWSIAAGGGNRFRVEEYKRPEFLVSVDAPDNAVKPGETVAAKINAKYYFGSPVPNATVKYTVRRSTWWSSYRFPTKFDWLWNYWNVGDYDTGRRNIGGEGSGTIVKEGTVRTDAQGNAEVSFTATEDKTPDDNNWWRRYQNPLYTVEAEVTDASRRTIEGQGSVRVANQQYFAFLDAKQGFYQIGDRIPIEIRTQDANDKPQAASGKIVVYKMLPGDKEERVLEADIAADRSGRTFWTWDNDQAGQFRIAWEGIDTWNNKVVGSINVWVNGPGLNTTQFRLQGVTIVLDKRAYEEGETVRALLVADMPDTTVLFTQEAGNEILKRQLVRIEGKSAVVEIPVEHKHVPNFVLAAAVAKNYEVYQAQAEVFVPPTKQLINVSVTGDKSEYKPGETGTFNVKATDWKGNPVRSEISLALTDASLFYIQKDYAPDIRLFYYGQRRGNSTNLDSSRSGHPQGATEDDNKYSNYEQRGWTLPDGLGQLNLDPAGWEYGRHNFNGSRGRLPMSGGLFAREELAADAAMPMSAPAAASTSSTLADGDATQARRKSAFGQGLRDDAETSNFAEAKTRSNFAETAFWSPAVVTENGQAQVQGHISLIL